MSHAGAVRQPEVGKVASIGEIRGPYRERDSAAIERTGHASGRPRHLLAESGQRYRVMQWERILDRGSKDARYMVVLRSEEPSEEHAASCARLTKRERQIAFLLASRATNKEIAAALGISSHTARHHTQNILAKLNVRSRAEVRRWISGAAKCAGE